MAENCEKPGCEQPKKTVSGKPVQFSGDDKEIVMPENERVAAVHIKNIGDDEVTIDGVETLGSRECFELPVIPGYFYTDTIKLKWAGVEAIQRLSVRVYVVDC